LLNRLIFIIIKKTSSTAFIIRYALMSFKSLQICLISHQGPWVHPEIDNPDYKPDPELYLRKELCAIGFDLWQVKSGTIFNNVLITDDPEYAKKVGDEIWKPRFVSFGSCN
jgi:hypothetical protein